MSLQPPRAATSAARRGARGPCLLHRSSSRARSARRSAETRMVGRRGEFVPRASVSASYPSRWRCSATASIVFATSGGTFTRASSHGKPSVRVTGAHVRTPQRGERHQPGGSARGQNIAISVWEARNRRGGPSSPSNTNSASSLRSSRRRLPRPDRTRTSGREPSTTAA